MPAQPESRCACPCLGRAHPTRGCARWPLVFASSVALFAAAPAGAGPFGDFGDRVFDAVRQASGSPAAASAATLAVPEIVAGLREALAQGTGRAVRELGRPDGYWADARARIPLPKPLAKSGALLRAVGAGPALDDLHRSMNRAAEAAVPLAADVFSDAVRGLDVREAQAILDGPPDAATRYFERQTGARLATAFRPIVADVTARSDLAQRYKTLLTKAGPLATTLGAPDLDGWVTDRALAALFQRIATEEAAIRDNPAARGTAILKKVFGG